MKELVPKEKMTELPCIILITNGFLCFWLYQLYYFMPQGNYLSTSTSLFRKKSFEINFFVQQNASKAIFMEKENAHSFFRFSFRATLSFNEKNYVGFLFL